MKLETRIHELLARRAERCQNEFRSSVLRMKETKRGPTSTTRVYGPREVLADAKAITSRRGFLHEQLRLPSLTLLKKWHIQLQLIEMDDRRPTHVSSSHTCHKGDSSGNPQSPLERSLAAIQCDLLCFDVSYVASATRIADLNETLFDRSDRTVQRASEALTFSSTKEGYTMRVVLFTVESSKSVRVKSSLFVPGLQTHVDNLTADSDLSDGIRLLLDALWR